MTKREYYKELKKTIDEGFTAYQKKRQEYNRLREQRDRQDYSARYINSELIPEMAKIKRQLEDIQYNTRETVRKLTEEIKKTVSDSNRLNPEDLTEDVKLLQGGLILKKRDIEGILERNSDNRTMIQLALRYAEEHDIKLDAVYIENSSSVFDSAQSALDIVVKWYDTDKKETFDRVYDCIFSEGSELYQTCSE